MWRYDLSPACALLLPAEDTLEELAGFGHDEAEAVEVVQDLQKLVAVKGGNRVGKLATFT